ncbi:hypothetical protein BRAS3843_1070066 [Bradyrhizobium sp. STM 3843]|nr:hypothetical protein BRAS3843_1070066 [Bradyrhizobium sp. STM 3843]
MSFSMCLPSRNTHVRRPWRPGFIALYWDYMETIGGKTSHILQASGAKAPRLPVTLRSDRRPVERS